MKGKRVRNLGAVHMKRVEGTLSVSIQTCDHANRRIRSLVLLPIFLFVQIQSNDFLNSNKAVFILLGCASLPHPLLLLLLLTPDVQPHYSRISFPLRISLKRCHVGWRQSAEMLLRYSCFFSKAPNSIYGHIYYHVCQWLKGSFIIRSTHLIWSQRAASLGQYVLYYTVRASPSIEEKENMTKQKSR